MTVQVEVNSLRQRIFRFIDKYKAFFYDENNSKQQTNKRLYDEFPKENQISIRRYKQHYYTEKANEDALDISLGLNCENEIKVSHSGSKNNDKAFQIFPLLKTFKLLPLYLFKLVYQHAKRLSSKKDFMISNIFCNLMDSINRGHYRFIEISNFMLNIDKNLGIFLTHDSWKRDLINNVTNWIEELFFEVEKKRKGDLSEAYTFIRGKILTYLLPSLYGIYFYDREKKYIVEDFAKSCMVLNYCRTEMISLTDLIDRYNEDLIYREMPDKYIIDLGFNERLEFMNPQEYERLLELQQNPNKEQLEYKKYLNL